MHIRTYTDEYDSPSYESMMMKRSPALSVVTPPSSSSPPSPSPSCIHINVSLTFSTHTHSFTSSGGRHHHISLQFPPPPLNYAHNRSPSNRFNVDCFAAMNKCEAADVARGGIPAHVLLLQQTDVAGGRFQLLPAGYDAGAAADDMMMLYRGGVTSAATLPGPNHLHRLDHLLMLSSSSSSSSPTYVTGAAVQFAGAKSSSSRRAKKRQNKPPQRGLGVAQLEKIRLEEQRRASVQQAAAALRRLNNYKQHGGDASTSDSHHQQQQSTQAAPPSLPADASNYSATTQLLLLLQSGNGCRVPLKQQLPYNYTTPVFSATASSASAVATPASASSTIHSSSLSQIDLRPCRPTPLFARIDVNAASAPEPNPPDPLDLFLPPLPSKKTGKQQHVAVPMDTIVSTGVGGRFRPSYYNAFVSSASAPTGAPNGLWPDRAQRLRSGVPAAGGRRPCQSSSGAVAMMNSANLPSSLQQQMMELSSFQKLRRGSAVVDVTKSKVLLRQQQENSNVSGDRQMGEEVEARMVGSVAGASDVLRGAIKFTMEEFGAVEDVVERAGCNSYSGNRAAEMMVGCSSCECDGEKGMCLLGVRSSSSNADAADGSSRSSTTTSSCTETEAVASESRDADGEENQRMKTELTLKPPEIGEVEAQALVPALVMAEEAAAPPVSFLSLCVPGAVTRPSPLSGATKSTAGFCATCGKVVT